MIIYTQHLNLKIGDIPGTLYKLQVLMAQIVVSINCTSRLLYNVQLPGANYKQGQADDNIDTHFSLPSLCIALKFRLKENHT